MERIRNSIAATAALILTVNPETLRDERNLHHNKWTTVRGHHGLSKVRTIGAGTALSD
jgi:hypothetical protein